MSDQQDKASLDWLTQLLTLQGVTTSVVGHHVDDGTGDSSYWLTIDETALSEQQIEMLLGEKGSVLDSIQYLANTILNLHQNPEEQQSYTIELAGYRQRRLAALKEMAEQAAAQAQATGEEFEIEHLSSAERRQVHNLLKEYDGLETFSRGKEPDRRLVVRLIESN